MASENSNLVTLDAPPVIVNGRVLTPLRFICEAFGYQVNWCQATQTASILKTSLLTMSDQNLNEILANASVPVLVDFWKSGCEPCQEIVAVINSLSAEDSGRLIIGKLKVDNNQQVTNTYNIIGFPTMILFENGKEILRIVGFKTKDELMSQIDKVLN
jgi:thioredoxin 1